MRSEINAHKLQQENSTLFKETCAFKQHVDKEWYDDVELFKQVQTQLEATWPKYEDSADLLI